MSHGYSRADCRGNERDAASDRGVRRPAGGETQASTEWHKYWTDGRRNKHSQSKGWWIQEEKGRPSHFGSGDEKSLEKSFPVWQRKMQNYIISVFPDLREPLEWAAMTAVPITHQLVDQRFGSEADPTDQVTDLEDKMHQVFAVLMEVTEE